MAKRMVEIGNTSGAKAADAEYFASDLLPAENSTLIIVVSALADDVQITLDSGTTWTDLTSALTAATHTEFTVHVSDSDTVNFRTNDAGGTTLDYFRVYKETQ